jgi:hypothetical protein
MQKRSSTRKGTAKDSDLAPLVEGLSREARGEGAGLSTEVRHLIAVALGRQGGLKGGKARAKKLSKKKRSAIAKKAAEARWAGRKK